VDVQRVSFYVPKPGSAHEEWEDGAADGPQSWAGGRVEFGRRFAVADGATEAYAARRWVQQLLDSFITADPAEGAAGPEIDSASVHRWMEAMQQQWQRRAVTGSSPFEQAKIRQGTLATFVGGQILKLSTAHPTWEAVALGDSVLFHVRHDRLIGKLPKLRAADFGKTPDGVSTLSARLDQMSRQLQFGKGPLEAGDLIFVATDALAQWMLSCDERGDGAWLWSTLGNPALHPDVFTKLIDEERRAKAMNDDDVTLLRLRLVSQAPTAVLVYQ
jgi:hypothetical protein